MEIPILYEDRSIIAIDKPAQWLLVPSSWDRTGRNLQRAIDSSIQGGEYWASSRNLKFLRFIHRLDAETTGVLLFAKSPGAITTFSNLFQTRSIQKIYLAVVQGIPKEKEWGCNAPIGEDPNQRGGMRIDAKAGKASETRFRLRATNNGFSLIEAEPITGRTHQIRLHLREANLSILGDPLYGGMRSPVDDFPMALRATEVHYRDPFTRKPVHIRAPERAFLKAFGFPIEQKQPAPRAAK